MLFENMLQLISINLSFFKYNIIVVEYYFITFISLRVSIIIYLTFSNMLFENMLQLISIYLSFLNII